MEEWKEYKLEDLCDELSDGLHKAPKFEENGEYIFVNAKNLSNGKIIDIDKSKHSSYEEYRKYKIGLNDRTLLYSIDGTIGNLAKYNNEKCILGKGACYLIIKDSVSRDFIYYQLQSPHFKNYIKFYTTGSTIGHISLKTMRNYSFPVPPLPTQQKIAAILSSLDDKIELNNKINENLEQQAQEIYKNICQNAETRKFEDLISSIETGIRPKGGAELSGIPSIGAEKIEGLGKYDYSNEKYISLEFFSKMKRGIVLSKDVLLYKDGAYTGKSSMALNGFPHKECAVNEHVFILRTKDNYAQFFLYCTLKNPDIHKSIYNLACGKAAQPGLNQQELLTVNIPIPSKESIELFEKTVSPLMNMIAENALENRNLSILRDSLLPKLISGDIEIDDVHS